MLASLELSYNDKEKDISVFFQLDRTREKVDHRHDWLREKGYGNYWRIGRYIMCSYHHRGGKAGLDTLYS
ncbi:hypothetical protein GGTG_00018 [Gaeumannomyces tritici R3-111a-1]|uniref:Uncharacterized protein n=1 Tax=Gaeumannomyces tritici (strain R3-111a-1) TaxID=644352 RepID=J3NFH2_GAET3|nr:hypothetical protein GGTG_00018 [Gaeumannomyces tritici R3-111a-1]EJT80012.1 hypothetical protein GGTG_00018 [Gaeumannomyces tritici R3-111a-1]